MHILKLYTLYEINNRNQHLGKQKSMVGLNQQEFSRTWIRAVTDLKQ